jgi:predicted transposase/invertase (TIGR01784 family)
MPNSLTHHHDAFFKQFMSRPELARTFLREHLPPQVAQLLAPELPEQVAGSYVDEELAQHHSDLVFRVRLKGGDTAIAYILLEHKSSPDPATRLQLLRYIVRILAKWYSENEELPLPVVVPLVAHQGPQGWTCSAEFTDLFGNVPEPLRPYLVSFRHALVDFATIDDEALSADIRLASYLNAMKYAQRADLPEHLRVILTPELTDLDMIAILHYINTGPVAIDSQLIRAALQPVSHNRREKIMGHFSEEFVQQGRAEGRAEGVAKALVRLLEKRFGGVSRSLRERILASDVVTIEAWFDRALDARELQSVFEPKAAA